MVSVVLIGLFVGMIVVTFLMSTRNLRKLWMRRKRQKMLRSSLKSSERGSQDPAGVGETPGKAATDHSSHGDGADDDDAADDLSLPENL